MTTAPAIAITDPVVLTPNEIAAILRVSVDHVYALIKAGTFPRVPHMGRKVRVSREWFERNVVPLTTGTPLRVVAEGVFT